MSHLLKRELCAGHWRRAWRLLLQRAEQQQQQQLPHYVALSPNKFIQNRAAPAGAICFPSRRWTSSRIDPEAKMQPIAPEQISNADEEMLAMLKSEIKRETDVGNTDDINRVPPSPFFLHEEPGRLEVILRRKYEAEDISVKCIYSSGMIPDDPENNADEHQQWLPEMVHMIVSVSKGPEEPVLEITCLTNGQELHIETVSFSKEPSNRNHYAAEFVDLKEDLQHEMNQFLKARGINQEFCGFLMTLMPEKERIEYIGWLKRIESFVRS